MSRYLHIVCLDVPWPADYGGAIDMMNRIKVLHKMGILIHLHYFSYNERGIPNELNQFCISINVYEREKISNGFSFKLPFIVASRINDKLIARLQLDNFPILLEGIHTTGILASLQRRHRKIVVRMHNEESIYYKELARAESGILKKIYFLNESRLIKKYTHQLPDDCLYACCSEKDTAVLKNDYNLDKVETLPIYPAWQTVKGQEGQGNFCLYHGNLSVPENEEAAFWLLSNVFTKARIPFVLAGKKPSRRLQKLAGLCQHTCLVADPGETEMDDLVRKAHIHVLPAFNKNVTGIRLKLLHTLFEGRHCLVSEPIVAGTGLEGACHIGTNATAFASIITQLFHQPFEREEIILRKQLLGTTYDNEKNTRQLIQWLW
ncbi:MAG: glycosyltransferase family 4 protein [Chitinophagaceae bacterium]